MDRFKTMESFIRVARAGSFTTAADQMRMSRAISRRIQELETRLGARLLNRTTRFVKLTDIGTAYFEFCQELLGGIDERERSIVRPQSQLQGSLKISASKGFGSLCIADAVAQFSLEHEEIVVTLLVVDFSPRAYDFVEQGLHVAIRLSPNRDSAIAARKIGTFNYVVCASPNYLSRHGQLRVPADLRKHRCLHAFQYARRDVATRGTQRVGIHPHRWLLLVQSFASPAQGGVERVGNRNDTNVLRG